LLLNLVALAVAALPRGGAVSVKIAGEVPQVSFAVIAAGEPARLPEHVASLLAGVNGLALDAHSIQPYYAGRVAAAAGMLVEVQTREREVELSAA
jgi:histidine phosphotransferase ChpT